MRDPATNAAELPFWLGLCLFRIFPHPGGGTQQLATGNRVNKSTSILDYGQLSNSMVVWHVAHGLWHGLDIDAKSLSADKELSSLASQREATL